MNLLFNDGWLFAKSDIAALFPIADVNGLDFRPVEIPHDWLIFDTNNLYKSEIGWYKKTFVLTTEQIADKAVSLRFEGVYADCEIYINGEKVFGWKHGYTTFEVPCGNLVPGENSVLVRVNHRSPNSRWYSGAGIFRNVRLLIKNNVRFAPDGIYIHSEPVCGEDLNGPWLLNADVEILGWSRGGKIMHYLKDNGEILAAFSGSARVDNITLWDTDNPKLYTVLTELVDKNGHVLDSVTTQIGFKYTRFLPESGFWLNGRHVKINGVCNHHDLGALGSAVNREATKRQLLLMKDMGANSVRTSHNPPSVELMELADELGILICSEIFDMWERSKTEYDYAKDFPDWHARDVEAWIRRDRNHASVIMWSIGNEIYDTHIDSRGLALTRELSKLARSFDYRGNAVVTLSSNYMPWEGAQKCADVLKIAGYNYAERYYEAHHEQHPDWVIFGSETASTVQSRGVYHFPLSEAILTDDDEQCSSLGNATTSWGALSPEWCALTDKNCGFSAGMYIWTGMDYIGEPTPYHTKNSYFGQVDTAGFRKDSFYVYQAAWTAASVRPVVHLLPYWDFSDGQPVDVRIVSNAHSAALYLGDELVGRDELSGELVRNYRLPYQPGVLKAVAYDESGGIIATDVQHSFGDAANILLRANKTVLSADGRDMIFIEIIAADLNGIPVRNANNRVFVSVSGAARLVGLDNGDSTDYEQYKTDSRRLFSGKLLAMIAATYVPGDITVTVRSPGLPVTGNSVLELKAVKSDIIPGGSDTLHSVAHADWDSLEGDIPVRKITLSAADGVITAKFFPQDSAYRDVTWRVTNAAGIDSPLAELEIAEDLTSARVLPKGDGAVHIRCMVNNGGKLPTVIAFIEQKFSGYGAVNFDPYGFITGGLYGNGSANLTNGNERGVATLRDAESVIVFENVDFGGFGSDIITLSVFSLEEIPVTISIWTGVPGQSGSEHIADVLYDRGSEWNTYRPQTFTLPKRLAGNITLSFVTHCRKIHLKGFGFEPAERVKAVSLLFAAEADAIYGDTFTKGEQSVTHIGNNVTLSFGGMDFGETGVSRLQICGGNKAQGNTIHLRAGDGIARALEFPAGIGIKEFGIEPINGVRNVEFVFLPGSDFDFEWFKFVETKL